MAKKVVYKPGKGGFNLDERKSMNPYGAKTDKKKEQKTKKDKK